MQRWVRLPQGGLIDAMRITFIGKVESFAKLDEEGNNIGYDYAVNIGIDLNRNNHLMVTGSIVEIGTLMRQIVGQQAAAS